MKKLRLNPEELSVEPFEVESGPRAKGTVQGNDYSQQLNCDTSPGASCGFPATCGGTSCDSGYPVCYECTARCDTSLYASCGYPATCGGTSCDSGYPVCYKCTANCTAD